jgi:hypothetical protein
MKFLKGYKVRQLLACLGIVLLFASCGEDSETDTDMQGEAGVMLIHSAPETGALQLFIDSTATSNSAITYGANTPYLVAKVGRRKAQLKLSPSEAAIINQDIFLNPQRYYSFFVAEKRQDEGMVYVAIVDDLRNPRKEMVKLRFLNMVPDTLRLDLRTQFSTDTVSRLTFSNAAFKSVSTFQEFKAGTYTFEALKAGLQDTVIRTQTATFEAGKIYTIWVGGQLNGQGNKAIRLYIIRNN